MASYRIAIFTGPNGSATHKPCGHSHSTLLSALRCYLSAQRAGNGAALQFRLGGGWPWHWISAADSERYVKDYNLSSSNGS